MERCFCAPARRDRCTFACSMPSFWVLLVLSISVSVMQGLEDKGGEEKEKDSAEELFSYGPPLNLLLYIYV